jgi:4-amino-4-deoxy-L-arabinose transferase-like glycosyltransferase
LVLFTPAFLISATTVMCDVLLLALWIWSLVFWLEARANNELWKGWMAGALITLAFLTKYYGACLVLLLLAHGLWKRMRPRSFAPLLIPIVAVVGYSFWTHSLYGRVLLGEAVSYTHFPKGLGALVAAKLSGGLTALVFTGGCLAVAAFCAFLLYPSRTLMFIALGSTLFTVVLLSCGVILNNYGPLHGTALWFLELQLIVWTFCGLTIIGLAVSEMWRKRDAEAWLLGLWVLGTLTFAGLINWTVNGRSILPMAPAVAILLVRRLERSAPIPQWRLKVSVVCGATLALVLTMADYQFAVAVRQSAFETFQKYGRGPARFWFQGHWGYQYYMQTLGASALDGELSPLNRGDVIAIPENNTSFLPIKPELAVLREVMAVPGPRFFATMKGEIGAAFYASVRGPLPFAFGNVPPEFVTIIALERPSNR